ncbi:MAG: hypothetical protein AAFQ94_11630 [Bacteroidota bacterium]
MKYITLVLFSCTIFLISNVQAADGLAGKKLKVRPQRLHLIFDPSELRIAGNSIDIGVEAILPDGQILKTKNIGGKLGMRNFQIAVSGGEFRAGKVFINRDNFQQPLKIEVYARKFQDVTSDVTLPLHQEKQIIVNQLPMGHAAPGEKYRLKIEAVFDNGDRLTVGKRKLPYSRYRIEINGGKIRRGLVTITDDIDRITNHQIETVISPRHNRLMEQRDYFRLDYKKNYRFYAFGFSGFFGSSGLCGSQGADGEHGDFGPDLYVFLTVAFDSLLQQELLYAEVSKSSEVFKYLINPQGGSLSVRSDGGDGGRGGRGGDGRSGADGEDGQVIIKREDINDSTYREVKIVYAGQDGEDGEPGGDGGYGGDGGDGGNIYVEFTLAAEQYLHLFRFTSLGGNGGFAGLGGSGGRGGRGGRGEPNGRDGTDGPDGFNGCQGRDGRNGRIFFRIVSSDSD